MGIQFIFRLVIVSSSVFHLKFTLKRIHSLTAHLCLLLIYQLQQNKLNKIPSNILSTA